MGEKVIVKKAGKTGKGLFAAKNFKKGERILHVDLTKLKSYSKAQIKKHPTQKHWHYDYIGRRKYVLTYLPYSYLNHSCNPNTYTKFKTIAKSDIYALRDIKKGEELTGDYGVTAMDGFSQPWIMICKYGSKNCRKKIPANFFKQPIKIQKFYYQYLPVSIKRKYKDKIAKLKI